MSTKKNTPNLARPLYKRKISKRGEVVRKTRTLDDIVQKPVLDDKNGVRRSSFYLFRVGERPRTAAHNADLCVACKSDKLQYSEREGMVVCTGCGRVQSEGQVVGAFSDNTRMTHASEVQGDMLHYDFGYWDAFRKAVAAHPFTAHKSEEAHKKIAGMCLRIVNETWQVNMSREIYGSMAYLITTGAQFVQENTTMPVAKKCVDIILQYLNDGTVVQHSYTKFLMSDLKKERASVLQE